MRGDVDQRFEQWRVAHADVDVGNAFGYRPTLQPEMTPAGGQQAQVMCHGCVCGDQDH